MTEREVLKLALEAFEEINKLSVGENAICLPAEIDTAMDACRKALAQPEQICGLDVVLDESMPPNTFKLAQPEHSPNCALLKIPSKDCDCQDQQEPVAITITGKLGNIYSFTGDYSLKKGDKVYTTPPQPEPVIDKSAAIRIATALGWEPKRTWVGLTDEELETINDCGDTDSYKFARAIEAKLKEKNT